MVGQGLSVTDYLLLEQRTVLRLGTTESNGVAIVRFWIVSGPVQREKVLMIAKCWCEEEDTESAERGDHWHDSER